MRDKVYIYQQLITLEFFLCFELLFTLLEDYTLTHSKEITFDLLVIYFEYFVLSSIANNYLIKSLSFISTAKSTRFRHKIRS